MNFVYNIVKFVVEMKIPRIINTMNFVINYVSEVLRSSRPLNESDCCV